MIDELWSGVAVTGAPSVERDLGLSHGRYVLFAFALPLIAASALEALVALWSDRLDRRRLVVLGQLGLAGGLSLVSVARGAWALSLGLALAGVSSGVACGAGQASLVLASRDETERALLRWSFFSAIGDALAPLLTAASIVLGASYRGACAALALLVLAQTSAFALAGRNGSKPSAPEDPSPAEADDEPEPLLVALRAAASRPGLWTWLLAAAACTLLDELVVALAALRFERESASPAALATAVTIVFSLGAVLGTWLTDRLVRRFGPRAVLLGSALACAGTLGIAIAVSSPWAWPAALFLVAVTCAPHHPLSLARAYDELPGRPGAVQALGQLSVVLDLAAPLAVGAVADRFGLRAAMACLLAQPLVIATLAFGRLRESRDS